MGIFDNKNLKNCNLLLGLAFIWSFIPSLQSQNSFDDLPDNFTFNQAYIFKYSNTAVPSGSYESSGELMFYFNEKTNCWLFTDKCYGENNSSLEWVIGLPNGVYVSAISDEFGQKILSSDTINFSTKIAERLKEIGEFDDTHKNTGITKLFGKDAMGFPLYSAFQHTIIIPDSRDVSEQFITNSRVLMNSIYFFNERKNEVKLPVKFPTDLPMGMVALQNHTKTVDGEMHFELKEVAVINYKVSLNEFR